MDIAYLISELQKIGLTQTEIGHGLGCSQEAVSQMVNGKIGKTRPSSSVVDGLRELAKKHGLTIAQPTLKTRAAAQAKRHLTKAGKAAMRAARNVSEKSG